MILGRAEPGDPRRPIAHKHGFGNAGGGSWYCKPLRNLEPGHRVFAYVSGAGYVGIGRITGKVISEGAENAIHHLRIAYLSSPGTPDRTDQGSVEEIREELDRDEPDWNVVGFHLGSLRHKGSALGLDLLYEYPHVMDELPRHAGQYLWALAHSRKTRNQIDRDWLVEQATARPAARSAAGKLHLCRVASRIRLGKEHGERLDKVVADGGLGHHAPLRAWAAKAWGSSEAHRPEHAVEYACNIGDFSVRRALALTVRADTSTASRRSCWRRKLRSVDPDLEPTLARPN